MEPLASSRSSTFCMSNFSYFASRTPSATFSKSQNTARLRASGLAGTVLYLRLLFVFVEPHLQALEVKIDHRRDVQGERLRQHQPADYRETQRHARAAARAEADCDRQAAHERRHGRHHDRAETHQACLVDRVLRRHAVLPL